MEIAFDELGLHRVQAAVVPENTASARVLEKAGFREEGLARRYLFLDGQWKDHRMFARTADGLTAGHRELDGRRTRRATIGGR